MLIRFIWPGKTKDERLRSLVAEYLKRLARFVRCEMVEVRESARADPAAIKKESQAMLEAIGPRSQMILLDLNGREWSSTELAEQVRRWEQDSNWQPLCVGVQDRFQGRSRSFSSLFALVPEHRLSGPPLCNQLQNQGSLRCRVQ